MPLDDASFHATEIALTKVIYYTTTTAEDDEGQDAMDIDGPPVAPNQNYGRELKLLDTLFPMVQVRERGGAHTTRRNTHLKPHGVVASVPSSPDSVFATTRRRGAASSRRRPSTTKSSSRASPRVVDERAVIVPS